MTKIYWVRHGPTHRKDFIGWTDVPADLSNTHTLHKLDEYLPSDAIVISSDLIRCIKTADAIAGNRQRLNHDPNLREMNFGDWETKTFHEIEQSNPELSKEIWTKPGNISPPNGESWDQCRQRVEKSVAQLILDYKDQNIIIVAHLGVILTQIQRAAQIEPKSAISFCIDNLSVTCLEHIETGWRILEVNHRF